MSTIEQLMALQNEKTLVDFAGDVRLYQSGSHYWLYTGGAAIQSVVDINAPQVPVLAYQQAMLSAYGILSKMPEKVLNLGFGCGAFERAAACLQQPPVAWTAIEKDQDVLSLVNRYMPLAGQFNVVAAEAVKWLAQDNQHYDLILCDLFVGQHHAPCIEHPDFFVTLRERLAGKGVIALNLAPISNTQMIAILSHAKRQFAHAMLGKIHPYGNLVMCLSTAEPIDKIELANRLQAWDCPFSAATIGFLSTMQCFSF